MARIVRMEDIALQYLFCDFRDFCVTFILDIAPSNMEGYRLVLRSVLIIPPPQGETRGGHISPEKGDAESLPEPAIP